MAHARDSSYAMQSSRKTAHLIGCPSNCKLRRRGHCPMQLAATMIASLLPNRGDSSAMKLAKVRHAEGWETVGLVEDESVTLFEPGTSLQQLLEASDPPAQVRE